MNESFVMISTYFLLGFSNFIPDPDSRYKIGWIIIGLFIFFLSSNVGIILHKHIRQLRRYLMLKYTKHAYLRYQALYLMRVKEIEEEHHKEALEQELAEEIQVELEEEKKIGSAIEMIPNLEVESEGAELSIKSSR